MIATALTARDIADFSMCLRAHAERLKAAVELCPFRIATAEGMPQDAIPVSAATLKDAAEALYLCSDALLRLIPAVPVEVSAP